MICEILMALEQNAVNMGMEYDDCQKAMGGDLSKAAKKEWYYGTRTGAWNHNQMCSAREKSEKLMLVDKSRLKKFSVCVKTPLKKLLLSAILK